MFKAQRKLDAYRQQKEAEEKKKLTGRPRLNPKSEQICQKIQQEYYAQL